MESAQSANMNNHEYNSFRSAIGSKTSWLEQVLIPSSQSDINLLNEYSTLNKKLHSVQECSDEDLILLIADKRKLFRDYIELNLTSQ